MATVVTDQLELEDFRGIGRGCPFYFAASATNL